MFSASTVYAHYDAPKRRPKPPTRRKRELDFSQLEVLNALGKQQAATPIPEQLSLPNVIHDLNKTQASDVLGSISL